MSDDLATIDLNKAAEEMRERIRMAFVQMLTPEQFRAAVQKELNRFMDPGGGANAAKNTFSSICQEEFQTVLKRQLKNLFESPEWQGERVWDSVNGGYKQQQGDAVKAFLLERGPDILRTFFTDTMAAALNAYMQEARNRMMRGY